MNTLCIFVQQTGMFKWDLAYGDNDLLLVSSFQDFSLLWLTDVHHIQSVRMTGVLEIKKSVRWLSWKKKKIPLFTAGRTIRTDRNKWFHSTIDCSISKFTELLQKKQGHLEKYRSHKGNHITTKPNPVEMNTHNFSSLDHTHNLQVVPLNNLFSGSNFSQLIHYLGGALLVL